MKRMYSGLLLLVVVGIVACGPQSTDNPPTPNANASPASSPNLGRDTTNDDDPYKDVEVLVTITITDGDEMKPQIKSVLPESADLTGGKRVQWVVDNQSTQPAGENATVEIGPFKGKVNPSDEKPFGPDACDNSFTLNFLKEGKQSREISEQANFQTGETGYEYDVVLKAEDGSELFRVKRRPDIIISISGMTIKPGASPKATPKPAPTVKPRT